MACVLCKIFPWLAPKGQDNVSQDRGLDNTRFDERPTPFHRHWIRGHDFDPGAAIYAYDTLALVEFYPINRFGRVQTPMQALSNGPQLWVQPAATVYELPQPNGQIITQGLTQ